DDLRIGRGPDAGSDQIVRRRDVRDPVPNRLARRLFERAGAEIDRSNLGAEQLHPFDVGVLAAHVLLAHVHDAFESEARANGRGSDSVLARTGLRHDAPLPKTSGEHCLAERVVQLVGTGVEEILALEIEPLARREPLGAGERCRSPSERSTELVELRAKRVVRPCVDPTGLELVQGRDQRLGYVTPAVGSVQARGRHLASATKARTLSWSLMPGSRSSLDAASTAHGRTARTASRTLSGPRRPASITRPSTAAARWR